MFDDNDIQSLALVAWREARGEGINGCEAVMHIVKNRMGQPGFGKTIHDCIYGKNQFSSMSIPTDPQFNLQPLPSDQIFQQCVFEAKEILNGDSLDSTQGAHYYANLKYIQEGGWFERNIINSPDHPKTVDIGRHTFYV